MTLKKQDLSRYVIFGAGENGTRDLRSLLEYYKDCKVEVIDNIKYGHKILGVPVLNAKEYLLNYKNDGRVFIISGKYIKELKRQLLESNVPKQNIMTLTKLVASNEQVRNLQLDNSSRKSLIVFDFAGGFVMGGVECWSYMIAEKLLEDNYEVCFYSQTMEHQPPSKYADITVCFAEKDNQNINQAVMYFEKKIREYECIVFVCAHVGIFSMVSSLIKKRYPNKTKVLSVVHSSNEYNAMENIDIKAFVDSYICVNPWMKRTLDKYIDKNNIIYRPNPIHIGNKFKRILHKGPLKIGYASRLVMEHKRVDLMPYFICCLEKLGLDYELNIAGDGELFEDIKNYIENNKNNRVILHGRLEYERMPEFWRGQDIAINLSDSEGCPVSLLEAMEAGAVPIYTNTKGMDEFITNGSTGFVVDIEDMESLAERIRELNSDRKKLITMSINARNWVERNCDIDSYVDMMESVFRD